MMKHNNMHNCARPIFDIESIFGDPDILKFNYGGVSATYDFHNLVEKGQTDTILKTDIKNRGLTYNAERHTDSISAKELGGILHIADIGDVDITDLEDNSLFVFQKNSDCKQGCIGINNAWIAWNSYEHQDTSLETIMGFDGDAKPHALSAPSNTNQFYLLGWNGANKVSWKQPQQFTTTDNKAQLWIDKDTKEIGWM